MKNLNKLKLKTHFLIFTFHFSNFCIVINIILCYRLLLYRTIYLAILYLRLPYDNGRNGTTLVHG